MLTAILRLYPADIVEAGLLERIDLATTATAQRQQELRRAASALVLRLLAAPLELNSSAVVRCSN
jgi:hypothetical protein